MEEATVAKTIQKLRDEGVRITSQRQEIIRYLVETHDHPTADEIYQALADKVTDVSVATVYNNLRLFTEKGIVTELKFGDDASRFDFSQKPHYHASCVRCGKIEDFYYPGLEDVEMVASRLTGYSINKHRLEVYGLCPDCQKLEEAAHENHSNN